MYLLICILSLIIIIIIIIIVIIISLLVSSSHQCSLVVFHWSLSDSKSPQISRILLSILVDLNNAAVWIVLMSSDFQLF